MAEESDNRTSVGTSLRLTRAEGPVHDSSSSDDNLSSPKVTFGDAPQACMIDSTGTPTAELCPLSDGHSTVGSRLLTRTLVGKRSADTVLDPRAPEMPPSKRVHTPTTARGGSVAHSSRQSLRGSASPTLQHGFMPEPKVVSSAIALGKRAISPGLETGNSMAVDGGLFAQMNKFFDAAESQSTTSSRTLRNCIFAAEEVMANLETTFCSGIEGGEQIPNTKSKTVDMTHKEVQPGMHSSLSTVESPPRLDLSSSSEQLEVKSGDEPENVKNTGLNTANTTPEELQHNIPRSPSFVEIAPGLNPSNQSLKAGTTIEPKNGLNIGLNTADKTPKEVHLITPPSPYIAESSPRLYLPSQPPEIRTSNEPEEVINTGNPKAGTSQGLQILAGVLSSIELQRRLANTSLEVLNSSSEEVFRRSVKNCRTSYEVRRDLMRYIRKMGPNIWPDAKMVLLTLCVRNCGGEVVRRRRCKIYLNEPFADAWEFFMERLLEEAYTGEERYILRVTIMNEDEMREY